MYATDVLEPTTQLADSPEAKEYTLEEQVWHLLRRAHQRANALFQSESGPRYFTPPQFAALYKLYEQGSASQNNLGRMIAMDAATMQGVIYRLMERGMVIRTSDPHDRRRILLSLTEAGQKAVEASIASAKHAAQETLQPLNARERQVLIRLLKRIA